jgi:hypothetical protein
MNKVNNGRVDIKSPNTSELFQMYDKIPANQCVSFRNATEGLWDDTYLSQAFFSKENIFQSSVTRLKTTSRDIDIETVKVSKCEIDSSSCMPSSLVVNISFVNSTRNDSINPITITLKRYSNKS